MFNLTSETQMKIRELLFILICLLILGFMPFIVETLASFFERF